MAGDWKEKVQRIIVQRNLCSYMNETKWNALRSAMMQEMPFQPPYIVKYLFDETCYEESKLQSDLFHTGDWYDALSADGQYFHASFAIEWIKIRPYYLKKAGKYIAPQEIHAEKELTAILEKYHIPYEETDGIYCIYGYR